MMDSENQYPSPDSEILPELYEELDEAVERIEDNLKLNFEITDHSEISGYTVHFSDADKSDFFRFLNDDVEYGLPFLLYNLGITERTSSLDHNIHSNLSSLTRLRGTVHHKDAIQKVVDVCYDTLEDMHIKSAIFTFRHTWVMNKRRHHRQEFESDVLEHLNENKIPARHGSHLEETPDLVIESKGGPQVVGEIRSVDVHDISVRVSEFVNEAANCAKTYSNSRFIVVIKIRGGDHDLYRSVRNDLELELSSSVDGVWFAHELDELITQLENWGVCKQSFISEYTEVDVEGTDTTES